MLCGSGWPWRSSDSKFIMGLGEHVEVNLGKSRCTYFGTAGVQIVSRRQDIFWWLGAMISTTSLMWTGSTAKHRNSRAKVAVPAKFQLWPMTGGNSSKHWFVVWFSWRGPEFETVQSILELPEKCTNLMLLRKMRCWLVSICKGPVN